MIASVCCPRCHGDLSDGARAFQASDDDGRTPRSAEAVALHCLGCGSSYPVVGGTPILINSDRSVFAPDEIVAAYEREQAAPPRSWLRRFAWAIASRTPHVPSFARQAVIARRFAEILARHSRAPAILVAGSGTEGVGVEALRSIPGAAITEFDVYLTDSRMLVADLLDLPFASASFDAVVAQGVLEHVVDPQRAAEEIHRVLRPDGFVFATTPFVLGVHMPVADYSRFSRLGLIRLFRRFTPVECDVIEGAAVALAYSAAYFWMALFSSFGWAGGAKIAKYAGNYLIFWLRWLDGLARRSTISIDAAASYYYVGRRSETTLTDRQVAAMFKGVGLCPW